MAFGGVPINVPKPPILLPYATASRSADIPRVLELKVLPIAPTESAMGSIINAVAVLLIHKLNKADAKRKPSISRCGDTPTPLTIDSAIRLCKPHRSSAVASINPPKNKNMTGLAYGEVDWATVPIPNKGKRITGINAVADIGIASVIHHIAIRVPIARVA
jgi:hypothetical protein